MTNNKKKTVSALENLQARSANAVSLIRTTIEQLKATNEAIDQEHASNDSKIAALNTTNASLDTLKADNAKVIANFENLLS
jgi:FtsZ-binding cell division protein ZapB